MVSLCRMLNNQRHQQQRLLQRPLPQRLTTKGGQELILRHQSRIGALQVWPSQYGFSSESTQLP